MHCPYSVLGVQRGASTDEIKKAYKALVVETHPDKHVQATQAEQAAAAARFKNIQGAYQLLSDDRKRSAYEASRSAASRGYYGHAHGVNTDWSTSSGRTATRESYTSRLSRWEYLRRAASQGMRSLDQPLHIGLAVLLVGGVILFDAAHNVVWESRNKGKRFEDIQSFKQQQQQQQQQQAGGDDTSSSGASGSSSSSSSSGNSDDSSSGGSAMLRSAWLDSMRGRQVKAGQRQEAAQGDVQQQGREEARGQVVDKAVLLRTSPAGQMAGHRA